MRCAMCGYEFERSDMTCHGGCPLGAYCNVVCCPRCGYATVDPERSGAARRLLQFFRRAERIPSRHAPGGRATELPEGTVCLLDLKPGQSGHIADVEEDLGGKSSGEDALAYLSQFGLLPGTPVRLTQKRPVAIVQVGQTELALDSSVAARILIDL